MSNHTTQARDRIAIGNAVRDGYQGNSWGWFVGPFVEPERGLASTRDLEVKWGQHSAHDARPAPGISGRSTTLTLLISGCFVLEFPDLETSVSLEKPGDYVIFAPGVAHGWRAVTDSVVVTIRWPSVTQSQEAEG